MKSTREQFEEIWPVPRGVFWDESEYMPCDLLDADEKYFELATEWDARLDTFTRCQETTAIHLSLIDELVMDLQTRFYYYSDEENDQKSALLINRAKQIMEQNK